MDTSDHSSPIWAYRANAHKMRASHDEDSSNPKDMCSLSVVDLDLSLSPDAFGLRAFDSKKQLTRMLPRSSPCELRLMLPDSKLGTNGFHDVMVDNLSTSPSWRTSHISPADVTALRRRWPEGRVQNDAEMGEGGGVPPKRCLSSARLGVPTRCAGVLPPYVK